MKEKNGSGRKVHDAIEWTSGSKKSIMKWEIVGAKSEMQKKFNGQRKQAKGEIDKYTFLLYNSGGGGR